jgi:hypothetical protein
MIELKYATDLQGELDLMKMCNCFKRELGGGV